MRPHGVGTLLAFVTSTSFSQAQGQVVDATAEAERNPPPAGEPAVVSVGSSDPGMTLAKVLNRTVGSGYSAGVTVVMVGMTYKDLCALPCTVKLDPGLHELVVYGPGKTQANEQFTLPSGRNYLEVRAGSSALLFGGYLLGATGIVALGTGALGLAIAPDASWPLPLTLGGAAGTGLGIGMFVAGRTAFERVPAPAQAARIP